MESREKEIVFLQTYEKQAEMVRLKGSTKENNENLMVIKQQSLFLIGPFFYRDDNENKADRTVYFNLIWALVSHYGLTGPFILVGSYFCLNVLLIYSGYAMDPKVWAGNPCWWVYFICKLLDLTLRENISMTKKN